MHLLSFPGRPSRGFIFPLQVELLQLLFHNPHVPSRV